MARNKSVERIVPSNFLYQLCSESRRDISVAFCFLFKFAPYLYAPYYFFMFFNYHHQNLFNYLEYLNIYVQTNKV